MWSGKLFSLNRRKPWRLLIITYLLLLQKIAVISSYEYRRRMPVTAERTRACFQVARAMSHISKSRGQEIGAAIPLEPGIIITSGAIDDL
jgi:hypothetical protein